MKSKYITKCPECGSDDWQREDWEDDMDAASCECYCTDCGCKWFEIYTFINCVDGEGNLLEEERDE